MPSSSRCSGERVRLRRRDHVGDAAHLGRLTGGGHDERRRAAGDLGVLEHHVRAVAERDLALGERRRRPSATGALSPVSAASCTSSVADVTIRPSAGTTSPASSSTMSPGHEVGRLDLLDAAGSAHPGVRAPGAGPAPRRWPAPCSSWLEPMTTLNVTSAATKMPVATCPIAKLATADDQQHDVHRVRQLAARDRPEARRRFDGQVVGPVCRQPTIGLVGGEPVVDVDGEPSGRVGGGQRVPRDRGGTVLAYRHASSSTSSRDLPGGPARGSERTRTPTASHAGDRVFEGSPT